MLAVILLHGCSVICFVVQVNCSFNFTKFVSNFFSQAILGDSFGIGTACVAETHLSCQTQKRNRIPAQPVLPPSSDSEYASRVRDCPDYAGR